MNTQSSHPPDSTDASHAAPHPTSVIATDTLFRGQHEIFISHNGEQYRLRITKNGKLILTK